MPDTYELALRNPQGNYPVSYYAESEGECVEQLRALHPYDDFVFGEYCEAERGGRKVHEKTVTRKGYALVAAYILRIPELSPQQAADNSWRSILDLYLVPAPGSHVHIGDLARSINALIGLFNSVHGWEGDMATDIAREIHQLWHALLGGFYGREDLLNIKVEAPERVARSQ